MEVKALLSISIIGRLMIMGFYRENDRIKKYDGRKNHRTLKEIAV